MVTGGSAGGRSSPWAGCGFKGCGCEVGGGEHRNWSRHSSWSKDGVACNDNVGRGMRESSAGGEPTRVREGEPSGTALAPEVPSVSTLNVEPLEGLGGGRTKVRLEGASSSSDVGSRLGGAGRTRVRRIGTDSWSSLSSLGRALSLPRRG